LTSDVLHGIISQKTEPFGLKFVRDCFLIRHHRDILTDKDCEHVYELVYSSHRAVAQAAGEFLNERLFVPDEEAVAGIRTKRGKKRLPNTPLIRDLVQFFIESEVGTQEPWSLRFKDSFTTLCLCT
jgi:hypothetical protein